MPFESEARAVRGSALARRLRWCVPILLALAPALIGAAASPSNIRVGIYENRPMVFLDENRKPAGLYIDVLNHIAAKEDWRVDYVFGTWQESLARLETAEIDLLVDIGYNEERAQKFDFTSENVFSTWAQIYTQHNSSIESIPDLAGKRIAIMRDDIHVSALKRLLDEFGMAPEYIEFDNYLDIMTALERVQADAGLFSRIAGLELEDRFAVRRSPIVLDPIQVRIAFPKGRNIELRQTIDAHLRTLKKDPHSVYNQSLDRWLGDAGPDAVPWWLKWVLGGSVVMALLVTAMNGLLRAEVRRKTAEIRSNYDELRREIEQRSNAEGDLQRSRDRLAANNRLLMTLARNEAIGRGDLNEALRQITAAAAESLDVARSSVWFLDTDCTLIECACLYEKQADRYSEGSVLRQTDYPAYFRALGEQRIIAAHDAHRDPQTFEFSQSYLSPLGISSMLDAPVRIGGRLAGILCNEHVGDPRRWTLEEEYMAASLADFVALALDAHERNVAETRLRESEERNRDILESAMDAVIITDDKGIIIGWNAQAEKTFGYSREETFGKPSLSLVVPPSQRDDVSREFGDALESQGGQARREVIAMRKGGEEFDAEFSVSASRQGDKTVYTAFIRDITEQKRTRELEGRLKLIETELELARQIQASFLPQRFPPFPHRHEFEIYAKMIPAREVGGDFFDFFMLDDDRLAFALGDVSGKGIPGALVMAMTQTLLKASARSTDSVSSCLTRVNKLLCEENEGSFFVTLLYGVLHIPTGEVVYGCAGHPPPYLVSPGIAACALNPPSGLILGVFDNAVYAESSFNLKTGESMLLYTDGVTEAVDLDGEQFAEQRLVHVLEHVDGLPVGPLVEKVIEGVSAFTGDAPPHDDVTLLALRYLN